MLLAGLVITLRLAAAGRHLCSTEPRLSVDNSILTLIISFCLLCLHALPLPRPLLSHLPLPLSPPSFSRQP